MNRITALGSRRRVLVAALALTAVVSLSACSSGMETADPGEAAGPTDGPLTIAYLQKQGDQQYFVDEANGAKAAAEEAGDVTIKVVDLGTDSNKAISELDSVIAQGVDGIVIVVPDQQIGPQVIEAANTAGIPIMASDDIIKDASGAEAPFSGFDGTAMGTEVGTAAAELYTAAGWDAADTRILSAYKQDLSVCTDRVDGAAAAFTAALGDAEAAGTDEPAVSSSSWEWSPRT